MNVIIRIYNQIMVLMAITIMVTGFALITTTCSAEAREGEARDAKNNHVDSQAGLNDNNRLEIMIVSGHPDYPPFMWKKGNTIAGVGAELVKKICDELDIPFEIRWNGPWNRVQAHARTGHLDLIVGIYSNNERREYLDYTIPYMIDPTSITILKNKPFTFKSSGDLIGKIGITMHGDSFGQKLDDFIKTKLNVKRAYTVDAIFKNLLTERVEYILWGYYPVAINAVTHGVDNEIMILQPPVVTENMYIAFSKKSPFGKYLESFNKIIKRLKDDGTIEQLVQQYLSIYNEEKKI